MKMQAQLAAKITGGKVVGGDPRRTAAGISTDSRTIKSGQAFVALGGENFDGRDFAGAALKKGARWVLVETGSSRAGMPAGATVIEVKDTLDALGGLAAHWRGQFKIKVAAVTGSVGKSTTKEMAAAVLGARGRVLRNRGNLNNLIGLPLSIFRLNRSYDYAVFELGCNVPGEIAALTRIAAPDAGIITRVAPVHLEGLGSLAGVARAKADLIRGLGSKSCFVLNLDDTNIVRHARGFKGRIIGYTAREGIGFAGESLCLVSLEKDVIAGRPLIRFSIQRRLNNKNRGRPVEFRLFTLSGHDAVNALAAAAVGRAFGVSLQEASASLRGFKGLPGRGEVMRSKRGCFVMDDTYNASPESVADALRTVAWWKGPMRGVAVLGEMMELGKYAEQYHREIGREVAKSGMDILIARGGHARAMARAAVEAGLPAGSAMVVKDNREAVRRLKNIVKKGDWILLKGSRVMGMESVARELMR